MPNGGFGCAYCMHYSNSWCNLRKAKIRNDHWTVCEDIAFSYSANQSLGLPMAKPNYWEKERPSKSSIYAITSDEGAYIQVPWLDDGEIHVVNSLRSCFICEKSRTQGKGILWRGNKYFFCSYAHYLTWRNQQIAEHQLDQEPTNEAALQRFNDYRELQVIKENTTQEQRDQANKASEEKKSYGKWWYGIAFLLTFKALLFIYHAIFN